MAFSRNEMSQLSVHPGLRPRCCLNLLILEATLFLNCCNLLCWFGAGERGGLDERALVVGCRLIGRLGRRLREFGPDLDRNTFENFFLGASVVFGVSVVAVLVEIPAFSICFEFGMSLRCSLVKSTRLFGSEAFFKTESIRDLASRIDGSVLAERANKLLKLTDSQDLQHTAR